MFTRNGKKYIIKHDGKFYLPVRKVRKYWKEVTETIVTTTYWGYTNLWGGGGNVYVKANQATAGSYAYWKYPGAPAVWSESELTNQSTITSTGTTQGWPELGILEECITINELGATFNRCPSCDFGGTTTTTKIVEGTASDYTYYEDVLMQY